MRRILVPVIAVALFAVPVAPAWAALGDTSAERAKLVRKGSVRVAGTIDCTPPSPYVQGETVFSVTVEVSQGGGSGVNQSPPVELTGTCPKSGPGTWAVNISGQGPFHPGRAVIFTKGSACSGGPPFFCDTSERHGQDFILH
jgi:hypothetical protein